MPFPNYFRRGSLRVVEEEDNEVEINMRVCTWHNAANEESA